MSLYKHLKKEKIFTALAKMAEAKDQPFVAPEIGALPDLENNKTKEITKPLTEPEELEPAKPISLPVSNSSMTSNQSHSVSRKPGEVSAPQKQQHFTPIPNNRLAAPMSKMARNTGIVDVDGETYVNASDVELLGKLGFVIENYSELEKTSEVLDLYSYIEKVAGVPKSVAKAVDKGEAFSGSLLEDMGYSVPKGYEIKGDLCCPKEKKAAADPSQTILLTGHSGSGKTTLSKLLSEKLNIPVHRVDAQESWDAWRDSVKDRPDYEKKTLQHGTAENKHYNKIVKQVLGKALKSINGPAILEGTQVTSLSPKALEKFKAHVYVGGPLEQSFKQRMARAEQKALQKGQPLTEEDKNRRHEEAKSIAGYWEPGMEKFKKTPGVINYNHTEHQIEPLVKKLQGLLKNAAERPGLLANIHAKRKRGEKAAKPGDKDYPDSKQWNKLSKEAMTLSATKALLRKFRLAGGKVIREPGGGTYEYNNKIITLPTRKEKENPLTTLWHEYGHAIDPDVIRPPIPKTRSNAEVLANIVGDLPFENRANTNALNEMKRLGVPLNLQKKYIDAVTPGFNTYKSESYISGPSRKHLDGIGVPFAENFIEGSPLYEQAIEREGKRMLPVGNAIANMRLPELREGLTLKDPFKELHRPAMKHLRKTNPAYDKAFRQYHGEFKEPLSLPVAGPSPLAKQAVAAGQRSEDHESLYEKIGCLIKATGMEKEALEFTEASTPDTKAVKLLANTVGIVPGLIPAIAVGQEKALDFYKQPDLEEVKARFAKIKDDPRLANVKVRLGYSDPVDDIRGIFARDDINLPGKIFRSGAGAIASLVTAAARGSHYNPFTNNISVYGSSPEVMAHEIGHALDFNRSEDGKVIRVLGRPVLDKLLPGLIGTQILESAANTEAEKIYEGDPRELRRRLWPARSTYLLAGALGLGEFGKEINKSNPAVGQYVSGKFPGITKKVQELLGKGQGAHKSLLQSLTKDLRLTNTTAKTLVFAAAAGLLGRAGAETRNLFDSYTPPEDSSDIKKAAGRCWEGYEPVPGKEPYSNDSCRPKKVKKEEKKAAVSNLGGTPQPTMSDAGPLITRHSPINIPTETIHQQTNRPSLGNVLKDTLNVNDAAPYAATGVRKFVGNVANLGANLTSKLNKFVPGVGIAVGEANARQRLAQNVPDTTGAAIDRFGGFAGALPVAGTALSLGAAAVNTGRDFYNSLAKTQGAPYMPQDNHPAIHSYIAPQQNPPTQLLGGLLAKRGAADKEVVSSNLKAVGHDKKSKMLEIAFKNGGEYKYKDVPRSLYHRLLKVKSPGKFFHKHIKRDKPFEYEKVASLGKLMPLVSKGLNPLFHAVSGANAESFIKQKVPKIMSASEGIARNLVHDTEAMVGQARQPGSLNVLPALSPQGAHYNHDALLKETLSGKFNTTDPYFKKFTLGSHAGRKVRAAMPGPVGAYANEELLTTLNPGGSKNWGTVSFSPNGPLQEYGNVGLVANQSKMPPTAISHLARADSGEVQLPSRLNPQTGNIHLPAVEGKIFYIPGTTSRDQIQALIAQHGRHNVVPWNRANRNKFSYLTKSKKLQSVPVSNSSQGNVADYELAKTAPHFAEQHQQAHKDLINYFEKDGGLKKIAGATPERIRELILKAAKGCKDSSACLSRMSASRKGKPAPRAAKVKPAIVPIGQPAANAQGMLPFAASHEFELAKNKVDPTYKIDPSKYLGKQGELEKNATTISALKSIIRTLRARGVTVTKDPKAYANKIFSQINKEVPGMFADSSALQKHIADNFPPSFNPSNRTVYVPRNLPSAMAEETRAGRKLLKTYRMSDAVMHEGAGHAMHYLDDPHPMHMSIAMNAHMRPAESLALERIANNNAINHMRTSAVPEHMVDNYKQNFANPGYGVYKKHMAWDKASARSPAFSVENPAINAPGQLDKLYKPFEEIVDQATKRYMSKSSEVSPTRLQKIMREKSTSTDEYLQNLADEKEKLNNKFLDIIKSGGIVKEAMTLCHKDNTQQYILPRK